MDAQLGPAAGVRPVRRAGGGLSASAPLRVPAVASQLEPFFNAALAERLGAPVLALPRGVPSALPQDIRVLVAAPMDRAAAAPPDWPFGLEWIQLLTSGTDMYPVWLLDTVPVNAASRPKRSPSTSRR